MTELAKDGKDLILKMSCTVFCSV